MMKVIVPVPASAFYRMLLPAYQQRDHRNADILHLLKGIHQRYNFLNILMGQQVTPVVNAIPESFMMVIPSQRVFRKSRGYV
jgi:hypothetical protein